MGFFSRVMGWVKEKIEGPKSVGMVYQRDLDLRKQLVQARLRPHTQPNVKEISYRERDLRALLKDNYDSGDRLLANIEAFQRLFTRNFTPYNAPAWKEKLGKEIISPAVSYWENLERIRQSGGTGIEGNPQLDAQKLQAYRQTLGAVADKDFKESGNIFLSNLARSIRVRQNQIIKLLAAKIDRALEPPKNKVDIR
ncbi:hypothetical protein HYT55_03925 [Candidatus Woesearchaeota archaeon]|nr:hypothetical protein [Candidatus Woesearchaeota archaeon]